MHLLRSKAGNPNPLFRTRGRILAHSHQNLLWDCEHLSSHFYALRHGRSLANQAGIIASNPATACHEYGLTEEGRVQAAAAGRAVLDVLQQQQQERQVQIVWSDLLRAVETAETVRNTLVDASIIDVPHVVLDERLRERDFGAWDGTSDQNYVQVWQDDAIDSSHTNHGVESVDHVMQRATACVEDWNARLPPYTTVVLVAHGDVLQILQTAFMRRDGRKHRSMKHLETAQLRPLVLARRTDT